MTKEGKMQSIQFPPYGFMDNDYLRNLGSKNLAASPAEPIVPPDFKAPPSCDGPQRERHWKEFLDHIMREMADALWPAWDSQHQTWRGAAVQSMSRLTRADLNILMHLRVGPGSLPLDALPASKPRALNCPSHSAFFLEEDKGKIFASYAFYDRTLEPKYSAIFSDAFFAGLASKCSSTQLQFKRHFQRPRAYQVAFFMGETEFNLEEATSSMTPSMVSGHSLQGLIGVGAVMERIVESGMSFTKDSWQALSQYAVDIGDRRVMAGVHYPSDNLGSWIVLMRLANRIYSSVEIKERLWQAISGQSLVYRLILNSNSDSYSAGLDLLARMKDSE
jgi:hypothetical protein